MLTITKLQNWANAVPANIKAIVAAHLSKMDFSYMVLDEDTHTYTSTKNPEVQWTSVTTLIKHYRPEQDWDRIASTWGKSHGVQTRVVREMWEYNADCAAATGSICHLFGEFICNIMINLMLCKSIEEDIAAFKLVFPFQLKNNDMFLPTMIGQTHVIEFWERVISDQKRWPLAAECIVDDPERGVCGTVDLLMIESDLSISMWDYKTSKKLDNPYARTKKVYLLNEYAGMFDEPISEYTIQLAQYKHMLAKHGINVKDTNIIHIPNTELSELKIVPVDTNDILVF